MPAIRDYLTSPLTYFAGALVVLVCGIYACIENLSAGLSLYDYSLADAGLIYLIYVPLMGLKAYDRLHQSGAEMVGADREKTAKAMAANIGTELATMAAALLIPCLLLMLPPIMLKAFAGNYAGDISLGSAWSTLFAFYLLGVALEAVMLLIAVLTLTGPNTKPAATAKAVPSAGSEANPEAEPATSQLTQITTPKRRKKWLFLGYTFLILALMYLLPGLVLYTFDGSFGGTLWRLCAYLSPFERFLNFAGGLFDGTGVIYFVSIIVLMSVLTKLVLAERDTAARDHHKTKNHLPVLIACAGFVVVTLASLLSGSLLMADVTSTGMLAADETLTETLKEMRGEKVTVYWAVSDGAEDPAERTALYYYEACARSAGAGVKVTKVAPESDGGLLATHTDGYLYPNSLLVVNPAGGRSRLISYLDLFETDDSRLEETGNYDLMYALQDRLGRALFDVTAENLTTVYAFGASLNDETLQALAEADFLVESGLPTETDETSSVIVINNPSEDLTATQAAELESYLTAGGRALVMTEGGDALENLPNLYTVLSAYGVREVAGFVYETDDVLYEEESDAEESSASATVKDHTEFYASKIMHKITSGLGAGSPLLKKAGAIKLTNTEGVTQTPLLMSSADATLVKYANDIQSINAPYVLAVLLEEEGGGSVIYVASTALSDEEENRRAGGLNLLLLEDMIKYLAGERNEWSSIAARRMNYSVLSFSEEEEARLGLMFVGVMPLMCVLAAVTILVIRRRRRD